MVHASCGGVVPEQLWLVMVRGGARYVPPKQGWHSPAKNMAGSLHGTDYRSGVAQNQIRLFQGKPALENLAGTS